MEIASHRQVNPDPTVKPSARETLFSSSTLAILIFTLLVATVYGAGYPPTPIITVPPGKAPVIVDHQVQGSLLITYPDGTPVEVPALTMKIRVCGAAGCILITVTLIETTPGHYDYSFTMGSDFPTGSVTLYVVAGSMKDSYGTPFPDVDTEIGAISVIASSTSQSSVQQQQEIPKGSIINQPSSPIRVAQQEPTYKAPQESSTSYTVAVILGILVLAGIGCYYSPSKPRNSR